MKSKETVKERGRKEDLKRVILGVAAAAMVLLGVGTYFMYAAPLDFSEMMIPVIAVIIVAFALVIFWKRAKAYKSGLPAEDEMSKRTMQKAGYYAWLVSIYALLGSRMLADEVAEASGDWSIVGSYMMVGGIVVPALAFFAMYFWFSRKGSV